MRSRSPSALVGVEVRATKVDRDLLCAAPLLIQALTNLFENAGAAAQAGGWVEITTRVDREHAIVEVSDSGGGVPVELRERVSSRSSRPSPQALGSGSGYPWRARSSTDMAVPWISATARAEQRLCSNFRGICASHTGERTMMSTNWS